MIPTQSEMPLLGGWGGMGLCVGEPRSAMKDVARLVGAALWAATWVAFLLLADPSYQHFSRVPLRINSYQCNKMIPASDPKQ